MILVFAASHYEDDSLMPLPPNTHTLTHTLTLSSSSWRPGFVVSVETVAVPSERAQCHLWQPAEPPPLTSAPLMHAATYFITTPTVSTAIAQPDERSAPLRSVHLYQYLCLSII